MDPWLGRSRNARAAGFAGTRGRRRPSRVVTRSGCVRAQFFTFPMAWIAGQSKCMKEVYATPDASYMAGYTAGT